MRPNDPSRINNLFPLLLIFPRTQLCTWKPTHFMFHSFFPHLFHIPNTHLTNIRKEIQKNPCFIFQKGKVTYHIIGFYYSSVTSLWVGLYGKFHLIEWGEDLCQFSPSCYTEFFASERMGYQHFQDVKVHSVRIQFHMPDVALQRSLPDNLVKFRNC